VNELGSTLLLEAVLVAMHKLVEELEKRRE
jgi:hypothetical protein